MGKDNLTYIYTDGACKGNPGIGGWGSIIKIGDYSVELYDGEKNTTNNRMEIMAVLKAIEFLAKPSEIILCSDSQYVCNALKLGWAKKWKENNWMRNKKDKALNSDLWDKLLNALEKHDLVEVRWVRGHNGHRENERCDKLANLGIEKIMGRI